MRKIGLLIGFLIISNISFGQGNFDSFENERDVTSVVVTKNMFKLLSKMDLNSSDPETKEYLNMVNNLDNIKVFTTENPVVAKRMNSAVSDYVTASKSLGELMRINDEGKNIRFYSKEGSNENFVSELLMHLEGMVDGKPTTVIMSITGNIDLRKISQLTKDLKVPGSEELGKLEKNKKQ